LKKYLLGYLKKIRQFTGYLSKVNFLLLNRNTDQYFCAGLAGLPLTDVDGGFVDFVEEGDAFVD